MTILEFRDEMDALVENRLDPQLSDTEHQDYKASLSRLMKRAVAGKIRLSGPGPDGKVIDRTGFVIELRPMIQSTSLFGKKLRQLRLYLAEPVTPARSLLALHLATKEASEHGYDEQDESIDEAERRAQAWAAR